jgi:alpha-mannosidase
MSYQQLIILLPCHSLEDFPTHHEGDEAHGLLANWTALWHPALLAAAGAMPSWYRADSPPEDLTNRLIVVPGVAQADLPTGFQQRAEQSAACLLTGKLDRREMVAVALERLDDRATDIDESLAADFLALGYCYLQVELLTRQMRYSSNLDEIHFQNQVISAATAAVEGDDEESRQRLSSCFDILAEERDHFYPVDAFVLDLTMLTPATLGASLRTQLSSGAASNLLLSGELLEFLARREPETLAVLRRALEAGRVGIVGGEDSERPSTLLGCETILAQLRAGTSRCETILGHRPSVYGRRRFGLTPFFPQVLHKLGFEAAYHTTFEEGVFPEGTQMKVRWEGCDGTSIDAIARTPLDAAKPQTFLNYGVKLGESMDMDHVATTCLAHWPGTPSPWYEDLRRTATYCAALGKFVTVEDYFRSTDLPVHQDRFGVDQYRSPYLKQAVVHNQEDPISSSVRYWRRRLTGEAAHALETLATLISAKAPQTPPEPAGEEDATTTGLLRRIDLREASQEGDQLDSSLEEALQRATRRLAGTLPRSEATPQGGYLVFNPHSFVRRVGWEVSDLEGLPTVDRPVYSAAAGEAGKYAVIDVPPMGYVWLAPGQSPTRSRKPPQPLAEEYVLRNEFFEARIDPTMGTLRSLVEYGARGNRLSQQIGFRLAEPKRRKTADVRVDPTYSELYSIMAADSVETTICTPTMGEIVARGRLVDRQGNDVAKFRQTYRVWRGSRVLHVDIELEPQTECKADPWSSYYAARFAWANEAAELYRAVNQTRHRTTAKRFEAPLYIEIDDGSTRTSLLTGGLPFHRRQGMRILDTLLIVKGESCQRFRLGIGVELKQPMQEALGLLTPKTGVYQTAPAPAPTTSGWLFHVDARNVIATHWEPLLEDNGAVGFRARLLETGGRAAKAGVRCFREIRAARLVDFRGQTLSDCEIGDGKIEIKIAAHQWVELEARW